MTFRGDMEAPLYEHGRTVYYLRQIGTVQHRKHNATLKQWEYGVVFTSALGLQWMSEERLGNCLLDE